MPDMELDDRVIDLERPVGEPEGSFQFLSTRLSGVHKSLLDFQSEVHERFDIVEAKLDVMPKALASIIAETKGS